MPHPARYDIRASGTGYVVFDTFRQEPVSDTDNLAESLADVRPMTKSRAVQQVTRLNKAYAESWR